MKSDTIVRSDGPDPPPGSSSKPELLVRHADLYPLYDVVVGLDVHKSSIVACVLGAREGRGEYEIRTYGTFKKDISDLAKWLIDSKVQLAAMESTGVYWRNAYNILTEAGVNVLLANAHRVKNHPGHKTDVEDSRWLAYLARAGTLEKSRVMPKESDEHRQMLRLRQKMVQDVNSYKNRTVKLLVNGGFNITQVVSNPFGRSGRIIMDGLMNGDDPNDILSAISRTVGYRLKTPRNVLVDAIEGTMSPVLRDELQHIIDTVDWKNAAIERIEDGAQRILRDTGQWPNVELLQTIPGVSVVSAMILVLELGDVSDFKSAENLSSWAGMCPGNNESAGKRRSGKTTRGNKYLRRILCEVATSAVKTQCYFKQKFAVLKVRRGYKRSIVAIGNDILQIAFYMLTRNTPYKDMGSDYEELVTRRNASRWIRQLKKYNLVPSKPAVS
jgi:transposase